MDELLELRYKKPRYKKLHPYPIGSSVMFSVLDIRKVVRHLHGAVVLENDRGVKLVYNFNDLKGKHTIRQL